MVPVNSKIYLGIIISRTVIHCKVCTKTIGFSSRNSKPLYHECMVVNVVKVFLGLFTSITTFNGAMLQSTDIDLGVLIPNYELLQNMNRIMP